MPRCSRLGAAAVPSPFRLYFSRRAGMSRVKYGCLHSTRKEVSGRLQQIDTSERGGRNAFRRRRCSGGSKQSFSRRCSRPTDPSGLSGSRACSNSSRCAIWSPSTPVANPAATHFRSPAPGAMFATAAAPARLPALAAMIVTPPHRGWVAYVSCRAASGIFSQRFHGHRREHAHVPAPPHETAKAGRRKYEPMYMYHSAAITCHCPVCPRPSGFFFERFFSPIFCFGEQPWPR